MTTVDASLSGEFLLGGELRICRLGYGAMRVTGPGVWGEPTLFYMTSAYIKIVAGCSSSVFSDWIMRAAS